MSAPFTDHKPVDDRADLRIAIVVAFRDEERFLPELFNSLANQTESADQILLIDDGSVDRSAEMCAAFCAEHSQAKYLRHPREGAEATARATARDRLASAPELQAFVWGVGQLDEPWDVVAKMDGDLRLPATLLADIGSAIERNAELGVVGAYLSIETPNGVEREHTPSFHVRGPNKFYRRPCLEDISPLPAHLGWDTIDELRARQHGWQTYSITPRDGDIVHLRPTGAHDGRLRAYWRWGRCAWGYGAHPLLVLAGGLRRSSKPPYVIGGICYCAGWVTACLRREARVEPRARKYARSEAIQRLSSGLIARDR